MKTEMSLGYYWPLINYCTQWHCDQKYSFQKEGTNVLNFMDNASGNMYHIKDLHGQLVIFPIHYSSLCFVLHNVDLMCYAI